MNLLAVSDLHLNPESTDRNAQFLTFLETALLSGDEILLLGDLFDLWFGGELLTFPFQLPIIHKMKDLVSRGLRMTYVEGNRDFHIRKYAGSIFQQVVDNGIRRNWGERVVYAEHGDRINADDRPYRAFRRLSKNRLSYFLMDHLPSSWLLNWADRMEKRMRSTNTKYKIHYPENYCRRLVEEKGREGVDLVIAGHFHEEKMWEVPVAERTVLFYNLPGWESGIRYLVIPEDSQRPFFREQE